jgi:hypothetical protein
VQDVTAAASGGADAKRFKVDLQRLLYSLQWCHNATPPDPHLQLVRDPQLWFDFVATMHSPSTIRSCKIGSAPPRRLDRLMLQIERERRRQKPNGCSLRCPCRSGRTRSNPEKSTENA